MDKDYKIIIVAVLLIIALGFLGINFGYTGRVTEKSNSEIIVKPYTVGSNDYIYFSVKVDNSYNRRGLEKRYRICRDYTKYSTRCVVDRVIFNCGPVSSCRKDFKDSYKLSGLEEGEYYILAKEIVGAKGSEGVRGYFRVER